MTLKGRFIRSSKGSRAKTDPGRIEGRVLSFFGFGLTLLTFDWTLRSTVFAWPIVALAGLCATPFLWYCGCFAKTFLGLGELDSPPSGDRDSSRRRALAARQCRRVSAALDALIAGEDISLGAAMGGGTHNRASARSQAGVLSEYQVSLRPWVEMVFEEAYGFGAIPPSATELVEGRNISQLRSLSSVFREAEEELGR